MSQAFGAVLCEPLADGPLFIAAAVGGSHLTHERLHCDGAHRLALRIEGPPARFELRPVPAPGRTPPPYRCCHQCEPAPPSLTAHNH
jgi:hypothetical protein